jgi:hypothetical protein
MLTLKVTVRNDRLAPTLNGDRFFIGNNVNKLKINHKKSLAN